MGLAHAEISSNHFRLPEISLLGDVNCELLKFKGDVNCFSSNIK